jgi:ABC-type branched-subunit amino acid transport system substrate-binding protein
MGMDPAGNRLHVAMPRFKMTREDMSSLISYLKRLDKILDPGLSEQSIRIATILPTTGDFPGAAPAIKAVLGAYFAELNKLGGIYNRRIELVVAETSDERVQSMSSIETLLREQRPFALVAGLIGGPDSAVVAACEKSRIPLVGPLTIFAETGARAERNTFYLLSGVEQQTQALIDYSRNNLAGRRPNIAILYSERAVSKQLVDSIREYCRSSGWQTTLISADEPGFDSSGVVEQVGRSSATAALVLASGKEAATFAHASEKQGLPPILLIPGSLASKELLELGPGFRDRLLIALPSLPADLTKAGISEYRALATAYKLTDSNLDSQISALCSAKVLVHGLKLAGRSLSRDRLISVLEGLNDFDTGLMPRIGFGPNRRVGALGAYIVTVEPEQRQFRTVTGWFKLD